MLYFHITNETQKELITRFFPNFNFKKAITNTDYQALMRTISIKRVNIHANTRKNWIKKNNIIVGGAVKNMHNNDHDVVTKILPNGYLLLKNKTGIACPQHWIHFQSDGGVNEKETQTP